MIWNLDVIHSFIHSFTHSYSATKWLWNDNCFLCYSIFNVFFSCFCVSLSSTCFIVVFRLSHYFLKEPKEREKCFTKTQKKQIVLPGSDAVEWTVIATVFTSLLLPGCGTVTRDLGWGTVTGSRTVTVPMFSSLPHSEFVVSFILG